MSIKPVLVPDQDAATLRKLMNAFADASTGPTRQELTESRAAVAAAPGVAEGSGEFNKIKTTPYKANQMLGGKDPVAFAIEVLCPDQSVVKTIQNKIGTAYQIERDDAVEGNGIGIEIISQSFEGGRTAQAAYKQILDIIKQSGGQFNNSTEVTIARQTQGVTEARPDVMRHRGDTTIRVVKRAGKPIGEIGIDAEASEGNGAYYVKLYDGSYDAVGYDTAEEALAELKAAVKSGVTESAKPVINFTPEDIKELEGIRDLATLKTRAMQMIARPSQKPMKPEKVQWFKSRIEDLKNPMAVIKLMYDLLLSGEGNRVIGTKNSMGSNTYRQRFGEADSEVAGLEESQNNIDPVEQLRADIRRFAL